MKVLLTHTPEFRRQYYGERSLKALQAVAQVVLHEADDALDAAGLIGAARDVDIIVADRLTEGPGEIFPQLPKLRAFVRCAVDISALWSTCRAGFRVPRRITTPD